MRHQARWRLVVLGVGRHRHDQAERVRARGHGQCHWRRRGPDAGGAQDLEHGDRVGQHILRHHDGAELGRLREPDQRGLPDGQAALVHVQCPGGVASVRGADLGGRHGARHGLPDRTGQSGGRDHDHARDRGPEQYVPGADRGQHRQPDRVGYRGHGSRDRGRHRDLHCDLPQRRAWHGQ